MKDLAVALTPFVVLSFLITIRVFLKNKYNTNKKYQNKIDKKQKLHTSRKIQDALSVLAGKENETKKAQAIASLIKLQYFLVHVLVNKGEQYDDEKQSKKYCSSLTQNLIASLYSLEGKKWIIFAHNF